MNLVTVTETHVNIRRYQDYFWLASSEHYGGTLLRLCPEIVIGRYVSVVSVDGGVFRPTPEDIAAGWRSHGEIAYSPQITAAQAIPHQYHGFDEPGYDEFYVFPTSTDLGQRVQGNIFEPEFAPASGRVVPFVGWAGFTLHGAPAMETLVSLFWTQLARFEPESYVADGQQCLIFVSRKKELVDFLQQQLSASQ